MGGRKREREEGRQIEKGTKDRKRLKKTLNKLNKQIQIRQPNEIGTAERRHKSSTATKIDIQKMYKHAYIYIYIYIDINIYIYTCLYRNKNQKSSQPITADGPDLS